jgi:hypothetical protein
VTQPRDELAFSLDMLASGGTITRPLSVCDDGHLVVVGRTHWAPVRFSPDRRAVVCAWVEHQEAP